MCRYACHNYKQKYACFDCRKVFKSLRRKHPAPCPECGRAMRSVGLDFRAPRQADVRQWKKVELLVRRGFAFDSCGCGPGRRPVRLRDLPAFFAEQEQAEKERMRELLVA